MNELFHISISFHFSAFGDPESSTLTIHFSHPHAPEVTSGFTLSFGKFWPAWQKILETEISLSPWIHLRRGFDVTGHTDNTHDGGEVLRAEGRAGPSLFALRKLAVTVEARESDAAWAST
jgi:hypothetical protein